MYVGYARVSTEGQDLTMQIDALKEAGCKKIFSEKVSGIKTERIEFNKAWNYLRDDDDTLVVYKLDRVGRSLKHLVDIVCKMNKRKIGLKSLSEEIDTSTASGKLTFNIFSSLAEFERDLISERTKKGLEAARARGRLGGRRKKLTEGQIQDVKEHYWNANRPTREICDLYNISSATLYRIVARQSVISEI